MRWATSVRWQGGDVPRRRSQFLSLAVAVTVVALAAGCASVGASSEPTSAPTDVPAPTPTETPASEPVVVFDGDCAAMLSQEQRDALLDVGSLTEAEQRSVSQPERVFVDPPNPIETLGGLECSWYAAEGADVPEGVSYVSVAVVPAAVVPREFTARYSVALCEPQYDSTNCRLGRLVDDSWVWATAGSTLEAPTDLLSGGIDAVAANLDSTVSPTPAAKTDDVWDMPDCERLGETIFLDELIGPYRHGYWEGSEQPEEILLASAGVARSCPLFTDSEQIGPDDAHYILRPVILPGAGWQWDRFRSDLGEQATSLEVAGATEAVVTGDGDAYGTVYATDGTNLVSLSIEDPDLGAEIVGRMIGALAS